MVRLGRRASRRCAGDDPRRIHWKQTARTGEMIFMEREAERSLRISVLVDNAVDPSAGPEAEAQLEERISTAAGSVLEHLRAGYEVELISRSARVPFGGGAWQRGRILETLALLEPAPPSQEPLSVGAHPGMAAAARAGARR